MDKSGTALIEEVMGPPSAIPATPPASPDPNESDEGGEGELETHLRAFGKAERSGNMKAATEAFKAAVHACLGEGYESPESKME